MYDRVSDREERKDLASLHSREVETRMNALVQWIEAQKKIHAIPGHTGTSPLGRQTIEQLRSLSYPRIRTIDTWSSAASRGARLHVIRTEA